MKTYIFITSSLILMLISCVNNNKEKNDGNSIVVLNKRGIDSLKTVLKNMDSLEYSRKAENAYELILKSDSTDHESIFNLAGIKMLRLKFDEALPLVNKLNLSNRVEKAFAYDSKNFIYATKNNSDSCLYYTKKLFEVDSNVQHIELLVQYLAEKNKNDLLLEVVNYGIKVRPNAYKLFLLRGLIYQDKKELENSLKDFNIAEKHIKNFEAYTGRGWTLLLLKKYKEALKDFNSAINDKSNDFYYKRKDIVIAKAYDGRGIIKYKLKDNNGSLEDLKKSADMGDLDGKKHYEEIFNEIKYNL